MPAVPDLKLPLHQEVMKSIFYFIFFLTLIYAPASDASSLQVLSNKVLKESVQQTQTKYAFKAHHSENALFFVDNWLCNDDDENPSVRKKVTHLYLDFCRPNYLNILPNSNHLYSHIHAINDFDFSPTFISLKVLKL